MQSNFYVGLSAQISLQRRLETIANNVANASTAGFRAEEVKFESVLSRASLDPTAYATTGKPFLSRKSGEFVMTETGELMSLNNQPMLDAGSAPLRLDPNGGPPRISGDGTITQNNRQIGAL